MTDKEFIELQEYEDIFYTATQRNYVMFGSIEKKRRLSELYSSIFNKKSNMLSGCGRCALRETKEIAEVYYKEKEKTKIEPIEVENKPKKKKKNND